MADTDNEAPQIDETRLQAIRRKIEEVVGDAPQLAKLALEQMVTKHNPDLRARPIRVEFGVEWPGWRCFQKGAEA